MSRQKKKSGKGGGEPSAPLPVGPLLLTVFSLEQVLDGLLKVLF